MTQAPDANRTFKVENDTTAEYWHHRAENTLPPPT